MEMWPIEVSIRRRVSWLVAGIMASILAVLLESVINKFAPGVILLILLVSAVGFVGMNAVIFDILRFSMINGVGIRPMIQALEDTWYSSSVFACLLFGLATSESSFSGWITWSWIPAIAAIPVILAVCQVITDIARTEHHAVQ